MLTETETEKTVISQTISPVETANPAPVSPARPVRAQKVIKANAKAKAEAKRAMAAGRVITLLVKANPKKAGSASATRFNAYKTGLTVGAALKAGLTAADLRWDVAHKFISLKAGRKAGRKAS